jgi:NAD-dependent deacetylase sirtuin 4
VACLACAGVLKPNVVFFGGSVAEATLAAAWALFEQAEVLLVVGSSLAVWSGYRFARRAGELGVPVAIVNLGPTRADGQAAVRVAARAGAVLPALVELLGRTQMQSRGHAL